MNEEKDFLDVSNTYTRLMGIGDIAFHIYGIIQASKMDAGFREIIVNPIHGEATKQIVSEVDYNGTPKAIFIDNGSGISDAGLVKLAEMGNPIRGKDNFGTGARANTLKANGLGIVFVSKREDGTMVSVKICFDTLGDTEYPQVVAHYNLDEFKNDYGLEYGFTKSYTAVIMLGNDETQRTLEYPYGEAFGSNPYKDQFTHRFYELPHSLEIKNTDTGESEVMTSIKDLLSGSNHIPIQGSDDNGSFTIHYYETSKINIYGIIHNGEVYDVKIASKKTNFADNGTPMMQGFQCSDIKGDVSLFVELHDDYKCVSKDSRDEIQFENGVVIRLTSFGKYIRKETPQSWKDLITQKRGENVVNRDREIDHKESMLNLFDNLGATPKKKKNTKGGEDAKIDNNGKGEYNKPNHVPVPHRPTLCPICQHDITKLKGGETCPECGKFTKPTRKVNPIHSGDVDGLPIILVDTQEQPYFDDIDGDDIEFILFKGVNGNINEDSKMFKTMVNHAYSNIPTLTKERVHVNAVKRAICDSVKSALTYAYVRTITDIYEVDRLVISHIPSIIDDRLVGKLTKDQK